MAQLIVAGFHRSGTSLLTQLLHRAGLFVGDELLGANPSQPYGHFEDREVVTLHDRLLADNGLNWMVHRPLVPVIAPDRWGALQQYVTRRETAHRLWGFKDPRVCLILGVWKHLLPDAKVVVCYRDYAASTYSLERRHSREMLSGSGRAEVHRRFWEVPDLALSMWNEHNSGVLAFATAYPEDTLVVSFSQLAAGAPVVAAINRRWGLGLAPVDTYDVFDPAVTGQRDARQPVADPLVADRARELLTRLDVMAREHARELQGALRV